MYVFHLLCLLLENDKIQVVLLNSFNYRKRWTYLNFPVPKLFTSLWLLMSNADDH